MSLPKFNGDTNNIQGLADKPTQSASQLKALFDKIGTDIKTYINEILTTEIDTALGTKANSSGVYTKEQVDSKVAEVNDKFYVYTSEKVTSGNYGPGIEERLPDGWTPANCIVLSIEIGHGDYDSADNPNIYWTKPGTLNDYTSCYYSWLMGNRIGVHTNIKPSDGANWLRAVLMKIS